MYVQIVTSVVSGFIGAILFEIVIRPIREYRKVRKKIAADLIRYSDLIANPSHGQPDRMDKAKAELRDDAALLEAAILDVKTPLGVFEIPRKNRAMDAKGKLIRLSNSIHVGNAWKNVEDRKEVRNILNLKQ